MSQSACKDGSWVVPSRTHHNYVLFYPKKNILSIVKDTYKWLMINKDELLKIQKK